MEIVITSAYQRYSFASALRSCGSGTFTTAMPAAFAAITPDDLRRSGEPDRETLRQRAAHAGPVADDTLLYRIEFHLA